MPSQWQCSRLKLVLVSYRPVAGFLCRGTGDRQPLALLARISGKSDRAQQKRGRRGDDGARRVRRVGQSPGRPRDYPACVGAWRAGQVRLLYGLLVCSSLTHMCHLFFMSRTAPRRRRRSARNGKRTAVATPRSGHEYEAAAFLEPRGLCSACVCGIRGRAFPRTRRRVARRGLLLLLLLWVCE